MSQLARALAGLDWADPRLIGCLPLYPPRELFHGFGLKPVVLWGLAEHSPALDKAAAHLQSYVCAVAQCASQAVLAGPGARLGRLFFYNACDTIRNLPEILLQGRAGGKPLELLRWHLPQTTAGQAEATDYFRGQAAALIGRLEQISQARFSPEAFMGSCRIYDQARQLLIQAQAALAQGRLCLADFADAAMAGWFLPVEEHITLLAELLATAGPPPPASGPRVVLSGILPPPADLCRVLDEAGLRVTGLDVAALGRSYARRPAPMADAADYYLALFAGHAPCPTLLASAQRRFDHVVELCRRARADGFIFVGEKFCEYEWFDMPLLFERLRGEGLRCLALEIAPGGGDGAAALANRAQAFAEMLAQAPAGEKS